MSKKILVIVSHPHIDQSVNNALLLKSIHDLPGVTVHELYKEYPDFKINVAREQELLKSHDVIVWQSPFYWYSTPPLFKKWEDEVLTMGFAYGDGGTALHGKSVMVAVTTAGPVEAYVPGGYNNFTVSELLRPLQQTANLCGLKYLTPFALNGVYKISEQKRRDEAERYRQLIQSLS